MKHVHLIGIGGSGMSAIARLLLEMGYEVSGSDREDNALLKDLKKLGAKVFIGHDPENIRGADLIVRSSAIPEDNPEILQGISNGIPVDKRAEFLGSLMEGKLGIGVAGSHGKTTTSAMVAWALTKMNQDPSYVLGGILNNTGVNAHYGKGDAFVIEADEYDRMFLGLKPRIEVITNVEHDHPDCYPTEEDFLEAFLNYVSLLDESGSLIINGNDRNSTKLITKAEDRNIPIVVYGIPDESQTKLNIIASETTINSRGGFNYKAEINSNRYPVSLQVPGIHNVVNSLAVLAVIDILDLPLDRAANALNEFSGTGRRFEVCGINNGITIINDYAHHPTEIKATLAAAKSRYPYQKIWVVWQPHTFSRTQLYMSEFSESFQDCDHVIITEVYAAREPKMDFSSSMVVSMMDHHPDANFIADFNDVVEYLEAKLIPGDILLILSAGDADQICKMLFERSKRSR